MNNQENYYADLYYNIQHVANVLDKHIKKYEKIKQTKYNNNIKQLRDLTNIENDMAQWYEAYTDFKQQVQKFIGNKRGTVKNQYLERLNELENYFWQFINNHNINHSKLKPNFKVAEPITIQAPKYTLNPSTQLTTKSEPLISTAQTYNDIEDEPTITEATEPNLLNTIKLESIPPQSASILGPRTGSANLLNDVTDNETTRMQATGSFLQNVRSPNINKSSLEIPIGSKRKLENVDMFKNKLDNSAPFWQANGLENIGFLPPPAIVENGAFNKPLSTNPQKFVFMTYESGINKFYNCKLPMKVNIPSGDFGIYHVVVNEVLFRTDIELLNEKDYIIIDPNNTVQVSILNEKDEPQETYNVALPKIELKIQNITKGLASLSIDYLNLDLLIGILQKTLEGIMINLSQSGESTTLQVPVTDFLTITKNSLSGLGLRFILKSPDIIIDQAGIRYGIEIPTLNIFKIESCSSNFRHIFPPLQTTTSLSSQQKLALIDEQGDFINFNSIEILRCNFAGPQMFLLNSSAQTVCPISNEYAKQFNTCALSYNTNEETNSLIQMTSNVELTMKNTNDFKVWLTDNYGQSVKLKSPMYVQVTVQPFINESVPSKSE